MHSYINLTRFNWYKFCYIRERISVTSSCEDKMRYICWELIVGVSAFSGTSAVAARSSFPTITIAPVPYSTPKFCGCEGRVCEKSVIVSIFTFDTNSKFCCEYTYHKGSYGTREILNLPCCIFSFVDHPMGCIYPKRMYLNISGTTEFEGFT